MKKKRAMITVTVEPYERLQKLLSESGYPTDYLSKQVDNLVQILIPELEEAKKNYLNREKISFEDMRNYYRNVIKKQMKD